MKRNAKNKKKQTIFNINPKNRISYFIKHLARRLESEYVSGFEVRKLKFCRQFYRVYPIGNTLRSQLNWSQYRRLIQIEDPDKREYYELESVNNIWTIKNDTVVRMTLPENNQTILASEYQLYLPTSEQLVKEINEVRKMAQSKEQSR